MEGKKITKDSPRLDVYSEFHPMLQVSRLLGVFPFVLARRHHGLAYQRSKLAQIYSCFLILIGTASVLASYSEVSKIFTDLVSQDKENRKSLFVNKVEYIISVVISIGDVFFTLNCSSYLHEVFIGLSKADVTLETLAFSDDVRVRHGALKKMASLQSVLIFVVSFINTYVDFMSFGKGNTGYFRLTPFYFLRLVSFCLEQQFLLVVMMFRERFAVINASLESACVSPSLLWSVSTSSHSDRYYCWQKRRPHRVRPSAGVESRQFVCDADVMEKLRNMHAALSEDILSVNRAYEIPLIADLMMLFFDMMTGGYFMVSGFLNSQQTAEWGSAISWLTNSSLRVSLLSWVGWDTTCKAKLAGPLVTRLMKRKSDEDMREELDIFLTQLSQNELRFNLFGLFCLDMALLQAVCTLRLMVQAVTSYLLVLVQFKETN